MTPIEYDREALFQEIEQTLQDNAVVVYMKGTADIPMCGFSGFVVQLLEHYNVPFKAINVLEDPLMRQAIKDYNNWPTIPQIFVNGEFIVGCDIMKDMHTSGELKELFASISA